MANVRAKYNETPPTLQDGQWGDLQLDENGALVTSGGGGVSDVSVLNVVPGTAATSLGKAEDGAHTTGDTGVLILGVRNDNGQVRTSADGDYSVLSVNDAGQLQVAPNVGAFFPSATSVVKAEDAAHASGDIGIMNLAVRNDAAAALSGTDLDYTPIAVNSAGQLQIAGIGAFGSGALAALKLEDAVHASGDAGIMALAVRSDTAAATAANGDYHPHLVDSTGRLHVNNSAAVVGQAAHDAVIAGAPVRGAGRAVTTNYTAVATGDVADIITTTVGVQIQKPYSIPEVDWQASISLADTVSTAVKAAAAAGIRNYVTGVQISGIATTVATQLTILEGASVIWTGNILAGMGLISITFPTPLKGTAATAINAKLSITPVGTVVFNAQGYSAP